MTHERAGTNKTVEPRGGYEQITHVLSKGHRGWDLGDCYLRQALLGVKAHLTSPGSFVILDIYAVFQSLDRLYQVTLYAFNVLRMANLNNALTGAKRNKLC